LAITTRAPLSRAPKARAFPAPPAPITTNSLPLRGEEAPSEASPVQKTANQPKQTDNPDLYTS